MEINIGSERILFTFASLIGEPLNGLIDDIEIVVGSKLPTLKFRGNIFKAILESGKIAGFRGPDNSFFEEDSIS